MTDRVTAEIRSAIMSRIRGRHTMPEIVLASMLSDMGLRFESHAGDLKGRPDFVLRKRRIAVFCDGDFWHGHSRIPDIPFWKAKIARNMLRDLSVSQSLRAKGWRVVRLRESELLADPQACLVRLGLPRRARRSL